MIKVSPALGALALVLGLSFAMADEPGTPYCYGTGCLLGNDDPTAGCANSTGVGALLGGSGSTSVAEDDLVLTCTQVPLNKFGLIFRGTGVFDPPLPFGAGFLCSTPPFFRGQVHNSGPGGIFSAGPGLVAEAAQYSWEAIHIEPGDTWNFQCWFRDDSDLPWNTSNAYSVTFTL